MSRLRLGVLASHAGSTMQAVIDACATGELDAELCIVISNNSKSGALQRATRAGVPTRHLSHATHPAPGALDSAVLEALQSARVDVVLLCGYMKKLGAPTLTHYRGSLLNTHPSLLPAFGGLGFYGRKVHEAVIAAGESKSGVTLHQVTENYDEGQIVAQREVPVLQADTAEDLEERVKAAERQLWVEVLQQFAADRARETPKPPAG